MQIKLGMNTVVSLLIFVHKGLIYNRIRLKSTQPQLVGNQNFQLNW